MLKNAKRILSLCLVLVFALALCSCGKKEGKATGTTKGNNLEAAAASEAEVEEESTTKEVLTKETSDSDGTVLSYDQSLVKTDLFQPSVAYKAAYKYAVAVNATQNITTVYGKDDDGNYTVPVKAFVCSCGRSGGHETVVGTFYTTIKYEWRALNGGVYGQYATRITGSYLFHSVPYYSQSKSDLETEEYNKLGEQASLGCVRLCVRDAKWIYDNLPIGVMVRIYNSSDEEPVEKPTPITIDTSSPYAGWDPTDPDENNPWKTADNTTTTAADGN